MPKVAGRRKKTRTHNLTRDPDAVDKLVEGGEKAAEEDELIPRCKYFLIDYPRCFKNLTYCDLESYVSNATNRYLTFVPFL